MHPHPRSPRLRACRPRPPSTPRPLPLDHTHAQIPTAVFCQPPLGTVGLTEEEAVARLHGDIDVYISRFRPMKNTLRWVGVGWGGWVGECGVGGWVCGLQAVLAAWSGVDRACVRPPARLCGGGGGGGGLP